MRHSWVAGWFWMKDSAGGTPTDAVGTTALPKKPLSAHSADSTNPQSAIRNTQSAME
jgi:hypothetical protein